MVDFEGVGRLAGRRIPDRAHGGYGGPVGRRRSFTYVTRAGLRHDLDPLRFLPLRDSPMQQASGSRPRRASNGRPRPQP